MQQVAVKTSHFPVRKHVFVDRVFAPSCMPAIEQAQVPVRVTLAVAEPLSQKTVSPRHLVRVELCLPKRRYG